MTTEKTVTIDLNQKTGVFFSILDKIRRPKQTETAMLRQLLSDEKSRILHVIKTKNPESIYELSRILKRDFKAVRHDIRILEHFGLVELDASQKKGRERLKPMLSVDKIIIIINL